MNIRAILPDILYVGVNDREKHRFESLWPVPSGVSYNSYIVRADKTALIDSVEIRESLTLFRHLDEVLEGTGIDYLIVNHMEPDHSGSIPLLAERYPQMKIVGNRQTVSMIGGFYGITDPDRFVTVADGDRLDLGGMTLRFLMTPMVHWPETMMTFAEERRTLFTGDAFGSFGALNGGIIDFETETGPYLDEAYRYYSNIVGKYGRFVQQAIEKTAPLAPEFICPTHGPVWHERIADIAAIYDRLSRYEPEPGTTIVYGSMYGNTEAMAESIAMALAARGEKRIRVHNAGKSHLSYMISDAFRYDGLIVGAPTYSMNLFPPIDVFMKAMQTREAKNKTLGIFSSFTWASAAGKILEGYADAMGIPVTAKMEMKQGISAEVKAEIEKFADSFVASLRKSRYDRQK